MTVSFVFRARGDPPQRGKQARGNPAALKSRAGAPEAATETDSRLVRSVQRQIRIETWGGAEADTGEGRDTRSERPDE